MTQFVSFFGNNSSSSSSFELTWTWPRLWNYFVFVFGMSDNSSLFEFSFLCYIIIAILSLSHVNWAVLNFIDFFIKTSICMIWWINAVEMKTRPHTHRRAETHRGIAPEWSGILMLHLTILESFSVYLKMTLICILFYIFSRK